MASVRGETSDVMVSKGYRVGKAELCELSLNVEVESHHPSSLQLLAHSTACFRA